jgi:hypothetical protein
MLIAFVTLEYVPWGQKLQLVLPVMFANVDAGQSLQILAPSTLLNVPFSHSKHEETPIPPAWLEYFPMGHATHDPELLCTSCCKYMPALHRQSSMLCEPGLLTEFLGHSYWQGEFEAQEPGQNEFAGHCSHIPITPNDP